MTTTTQVHCKTPPDEDAAARFAREVMPLHDVLERGARRMTRNDADAADLLQDALLHAFAGWHTFRDGTNLRAWLFRILYNRWVSAHRAKQSRPLEVSIDTFTEGDTAHDTALSSAAHRSAEAQVLDALVNDDVKAAMAALPEGFQAVVYYADVQGYTYAETAAILDIPVGTVMSRVSRSRQRMRIALAHLALDRDDVAALEQRIA